MIDSIPAHDANAKSRLFEAAKGLESNFMSMMLQTMFEGISCDGVGKGGMGEHMFRSMLINEYASTLSSSTEMGIAQDIADRYASSSAQARFLTDTERAHDVAQMPASPKIDLKV